MGRPDIFELDKLHHEWEEVHSRLRKLEEQLSRAIEQYARGKGARPVQLIAQVEGLRAECAQRFQALMKGVRGDPSDAGHAHEPTTSP